MSPYVLFHNVHFCGFIPQKTNLRLFVVFFSEFRMGFPVPAHALPQLGGRAGGFRERRDDGDPRDVAAGLLLGRQAMGTPEAYDFQWPVQEPIYPDIYIYIYVYIYIYILPLTLT